MNYFEAALFLDCFFLFPPWAGAHDVHEGAITAAASREIMCFLRKVLQPLWPLDTNLPRRDVQAGCPRWQI